MESNTKIVKKIFVTGASGFVGKRFVELFAKKYSLRLLIRKPELLDKTITRSQNIKVLKGDLLNLKELEESMKGCCAIVHIGGATPNRAYAEGNFNATTKGTENIISAAKKNHIKRLIFISSNCVEFSKQGPYAQSKIIAENAVKKSGLFWTILRPSTI
ncbi:MAG: SDR family oxidoreductase, partial [Candidatus Woesearchaeota archaeon]|nr:SDR family oxidoreductase [Candidatus Woesearchaeota archaeon]